MKATQILTGILMVLSVTAVSCNGSGKSSAEDSTTEYISNPIGNLGSSPCLTYFEGKYYFCQSSYIKVSLRCADSISGIRDAKEQTIFYSGKDHLISAPRMYRIDDAWYIYYGSDDGDMSRRRIHVLCNKAHSPLEGSWEQKTIMDTGIRKAVHPSIFRHDGQLYLFCSGTIREDEKLIRMGIYACRLSNPWTIASPMKLILSPEHEWECQWATGDKEVDRIPAQLEEAPIATYNADSTKVLLYFAASHTHSQYYCEGMAFCDRDADLLDASSWTKLPNPVFIQQKGSEIHGAGHISFVEGLDPQQLYFVYHAFDGHPIVDRSHRTPRLQKASWGSNGIPVLGIPESKDVPAPKVPAAKEGR